MFEEGQADHECLSLLHGPGQGCLLSSDSKEELDEGLENIGACLGLSQR